MTSPTLHTRDLVVRYRRHQVLHGINLPPIHSGQLVVLAGPNGAGKSTLLKALAGLVPAHGQVLYGDQDWLRCRARERARQIGFMPQGLPQDSELSVLEATLAALQDNALGSQVSREFQALATLERLNIGQLAFQPLAQLSGGQRQLAGLAQAVVRGCPVLMLDEPVSALDLAHQWQVMHMTRQLANDGRIVLIVLHDLGLAAQWADQLIVLHQGRLQEFGSPAHILTPALLSTVWGINAHIERSEQGRIHISVEGRASAV